MQRNLSIEASAASSRQETSTATTTTAPRHRGAIWTLLLLAPLIAEVLSGSTRMSFIFVLVPEVMVWGVGALLGRELVRRWKGGGVSLLLMGLALSVAEEFIIQQTSIAPLPFVGANVTAYRLWGVNWLYLLFMLGFESVFVVLVPVQITELLFPAHRETPWLRRRGIVANCVVFVIGAYIAWFGWTQQARKNKLHVAAYHPPAVLIAAGLAAILLLTGAAYLLRAYGRAGRDVQRKPLNAWIAGGAAFIFSAGWFELITLVFVPRPALPHWVPMAGGMLWALSAFALFQHQAGAGGWMPMHRWAVSFGATMATMSIGYLSTAGWSMLDLAGKVVLNVLAAVGLLMLGRAVRAREDGAKQTAWPPR